MVERQRRGHTDVVYSLTIVSQDLSPYQVLYKMNGQSQYLAAYLLRASTLGFTTLAMIKRALGAEAYSFLNGFLGYNQIFIDPKDQHKTTFAYERGTFAYRVVPFGLTNAPTTFQHLMCHVFRAFLRIFLQVYIDDLCVYSKQRSDHLFQLKLIF